MQKLSYPLKKYIKAVQILAIRKGFQDVKVFNKSGSAVRFEAFCRDEEKPHNMWVVHTGHKKQRRITSREDYKKVIRRLNCTMEEFINVLNEV